MKCEIIPIQERNTCKCCVCQSDKSVKYRFTNRQFNQFDVCNKCYFTMKSYSHRRKLNRLRKELELDEKQAKQLNNLEN